MTSESNFVIKAINRKYIDFEHGKYFVISIFINNIYYLC